MFIDRRGSLTGTTRIGLNKYQPNTVFRRTGRKQNYVESLTSTS